MAPAPTSAELTGACWCCSEVDVSGMEAEVAGPVGEGMFSKKKRAAADPATPSDTPPAEVDAASFASGGGNGSGGASRSPSGEKAEKGKTKDKSKEKIKRDARNLLPKTKPEKVCIVPLYPHVALLEHGFAGTRHAFTCCFRAALVHFFCLLPSSHHSKRHHHRFNTLVPTLQPRRCSHSTGNISSGA